MPLNILFISQYFPPEMGAPAARTYDLAKQWVKMGHNVTVLTAFPHHPTGIVPKAYQGKIFQRETIDGINLIRTYVYAVPNQGFLKRTLSYISFMCSAVFFSPALKFEPQVIVATSPQFFVAIAGYIIGRLKRKPFVFEVRDLWPESIVAVGALKNPTVINFLTKIEYFLYRKAKHIIGVAESTRRILTERNIPAEKIDIIPNGVDSDLFDKQKNQPDLRKQHGLENKFVVSYIGTHGMAHALHRVLDAANMLKEYPEIHFLFVGEGAQKTELIQYHDKLGLKNTTFLGQQDHTLIPAFLKASDVSLVPLRDTPLFANVLPSKMFEIMAAQRPLILSVRGESRAMVKKADAGLCVDPENVDQMSDAILSLYKDRESAQRMGKSGHAFVMAHHTREKLAQKYANVLTSLVR